MQIAERLVCAHSEIASCFWERKQKRNETSGETSVAAFCLFKGNWRVVFGQRQRGIFFLGQIMKKEKKQKAKNIRMQIYIIIYRNEMEN